MLFTLEPVLEKFTQAALPEESKSSEICLNCNSPEQTPVGYNKKLGEWQRATKHWAVLSSSFPPENEAGYSNSLIINTFGYLWNSFSPVKALTQIQSFWTLHQPSQLHHNLQQLKFHHKMGKRPGNKNAPQNRATYKLAKSLHYISFKQNHNSILVCIWVNSERGK